MARLDSIVDISHHQDQAIDFAKLRDAGIVAVIHKATQGAQFKDKLYDQRRKDAEQAGLLWGAYHFGEEEAESASGAAQAKHFLDVVGDPADVFLCLDYESYTHKDTPNVSHTMTVAGARDFLDAVSQKVGRLPFFYSGNTIREILGPAKDDKLGACHLWLAAYVDEDKLKIQESWTAWTLWQYTDGKKNNNGKPIPGFGPWDRSFFDGTQQELEAIWAK
jgi:lysozyme